MVQGFDIRDLTLPQTGHQTEVSLFTTSSHGRNEVATRAVCALHCPPLGAKNQDCHLLRSWGRLRPSVERIGQTQMATGTDINAGNGHDNATISSGWRSVAVECDFGGA